MKCDEQLVLISLKNCLSAVRLENSEIHSICRNEES